MTSAAVQKTQQTVLKEVATPPATKKQPRLFKWSEFKRICSAAPVLPAFAFPVSDIFEKATEEDK